MKLKNFNDLYAKLFWDLKLIQEQALVLYPQLIQQARSQELKDVLGLHIKEIHSELPRIENALKALNGHQVPQENESKGLFAGTEKLIQNNSPSPLLDAALIADVLQIEHLESATYDALKDFADAVDAPEIQNFIDESLREVSKVDEALEKLAKKKFFTPVPLGQK